jgi:hypothetical protein
MSRIGGGSLDALFEPSVADTRLGALAVRSRDTRPLRHS